jgi:hypothetical protein
MAIVKAEFDGGDVPILCGEQPASADVPINRSIDTGPDHPFVVLTFSGGGSRAAALTASVTARLDGIIYATPAGPRRLSQDIAIVSSVSGGSVYAAYLALNGAGSEKADAFREKIKNFDGIR